MSRNDKATSVTRRSLLATTAAGAAFVAGCIGQDPESEGNGGNGNGGNGGNGDGNGSGSADGVVDATWNDVTNQEPEQWEMNYFNPTNNAATDWGGNPLYDRFMRKVIHQVDEPYYEWRIVSDMEWQDDNGTLVLKIGNGHVWHDGDDVTAQDVATQLRLEEYVGHVFWDFANEIEVQDDETLVIDIDEVNPQVMEDVIAEQRLYVKHSVYQEWLEDLEAAGGEDEQEEIVSQLLDWNLEAEESVGNGPFQIGDQSPERIRQDRFADYPWADNVNFSNIEVRTILEEGVVVESIMSGDLDGHHFQNWPEQTREQLPDEVKRVMVPDNGGYAAELNCESEHLQDPRVRRAVAHIIDREAIETNITDNFPTPYPSGLASELGMVESIAGDYVDSLESYNPGEVAEDAAAEELEAAGYERDGDQWVRAEDGEPLRVDVLGPTWGLMSTWSETVHSQLDRAGIESDLSITEPGTFDERYQTGDYDLRAGWWGGAAEQTAPWFNLRRPFSTTYERDNVNFPESVEVPWPPDTQDETIEINVEQAVADLGSTTDEEEAKELALKLAWTYNQQLPKIPLTERVLTPWVNTGEWETPEDQNPDSRELETDEPLAYLMTLFEWWPRVGLLKAPE
ncbi:ABC transporter substrate-binding protein [Halomontanus rarus]|uniref:ABC transporter substrate-binding protein n=1 Tax=Halomontanus rarus TaxID=3034020 RepID=UPI001A997232